MTQTSATPSAAKKAPARKASARKPVARKTPARKSVAKARAGKKVPTSTLFLDKVSYQACIDGLRAQGLDKDDAVETLKVGIRQANGRPVPPELLQGQTA